MSETTGAGATFGPGARFSGELFWPGDDGYEVARKVWNGDISRHPACVARCSSPEQVAEAIRLAREEGLDLTVRGGGHNFAGLSVADGALMIDLSGINHVRIDPVRRRAYVGGGCQLAQLDQAAAEYGLGVTAGVISHTGVAGLTLGGGVGFLLRKFGLTCDNLAGAWVVLADGSFVHANEEENPDLFWALRGGGGNFGVVTEFEYQLYEIGKYAQIAMFSFALEDGPEVMRFHRGLSDRVPDDMAVYLYGMRAPDVPFIPPSFRNTLGYFIMLISVGSAEEMARAAAPVREELSPVAEVLMPIPYVELQCMFNIYSPWGAHAYEKGLYLRDFSDGVIEATHRNLPEMAGPFSYVFAMRFGGAYAAKKDEDTAWGGPRDADYLYLICAVCETADELKLGRPWVRRLWDDVRPYAMGSGSYVNNMTEVQEDRVRAAYGTVKYDRLARIKARYDPENIFHHNQNIKPAVTQGS